MVYAPGQSLAVTNVPGDLTNIVAVSAGLNDALALREDGTLRAWGENDYGIANVPTDLTNVVAIGSGWLFHMALRADGRVMTWGHPNATPPAGLDRVVAIAAGGHQFCLALRDDGTVVGWGWNGYGQTNVPPGLTNAISVAAGLDHSLALRADGTVVGWGDDTFGAANVPTGLSNVVAISAGWNQSFALKSDGTVIGWGMDGTNLPPLLGNVVKVAAGWDAGQEFLQGHGSLWRDWVPGGNVGGVARGHFFAVAIVLPPAPTPGWAEPILSASWRNGQFNAEVATRHGKVYQLRFCDQLDYFPWNPLFLAAGNGKRLFVSDPTAAVPVRIYKAVRW